MPRSGHECADLQVSSPVSSSLPHYVSTGATPRDPVNLAAAVAPCISVADMTSEGGPERGIRTRREPPPFRRVGVRRVEQLTARMRRVVLGGPELAGFEVDQPAASVRLLLPPHREGTIDLPDWTGNQFELPGGDRAPIRTFTPREFDKERVELTLDMVLHGVGAASDWARSAQPGNEVAISGPGRGYQVDTDASTYLLAGDETAIPAISQLLEAIPSATWVQVHIEITDRTARLDLPPHPGAEVTWYERPEASQFGATYVAAIQALAEIPDAVWVAGEAAAVQRIRKHLFEVRAVPRSAVTARGYWKNGRSAT